MKNPSHYQLRDLEKALNADIIKKAAKSGGAPAWLKDIAGQLEDPEYCDLTLAERGLLKDLRLLALRRGNKIQNNEEYVRKQLRLNGRTRITPKLQKLYKTHFLEAHPDAHDLYTTCTPLVQVGYKNAAQTAHESNTQANKPPANQDNHSRTDLTSSESTSPLDKRRGEINPFPRAEVRPEEVAGFTNPLVEMEEFMKRRKEA